MAVYRLMTWLGPALLDWLVFAVQLRTTPAHTHDHAPEVVEQSLVAHGGAAA